MVNEGDNIAVWFSCGAASAVAAMRTLEKYGNLCSVRVLNNPVAEEDEDNRRFLRDQPDLLEPRPERPSRSVRRPRGAVPAFWCSAGTGQQREDLPGRA